MHPPGCRDSSGLVSHSVGSLQCEGILPLYLLLGGWGLGGIHSSWATLRRAGTQHLLCVTLGWGNVAAALSCLHLPCHLVCSGILQPLWLYLSKRHIYPQACVGLATIPLSLPHSQGRDPPVSNLSDFPAGSSILVWTMLSHLEGQKASLVLHAPNSSSCSEDLSCKTEIKNRLVGFPTFWTSISEHTADGMKERFDGKKYIG